MIVAGMPLCNFINYTKFDYPYHWELAEGSKTSFLKMLNTLVFLKNEKQKNKLDSMTGYFAMIFLSRRKSIQRNIELLFQKYLIPFAKIQCFSLINQRCIIN